MITDFECEFQVKNDYYYVKKTQHIPVADKEEVKELYMNCYDIVVKLFTSQFRSPVFLIASTLRATRLVINYSKLNSDKDE